MATAEQAARIEDAVMSAFERGLREDCAGTRRRSAMNRKARRSTLKLWYGKHWIRDAKRLAVYLRHLFRCVYCGKDLRNAEPGECSLDHLLPRSAGGDNEADNLVLACIACNVARGDRPWVDYATGGARDRIEQERRLPLNMALAKALLAGEIPAAVAIAESAR